MDDHLNATNHAIFNSFVHMLDPTETDGACCIPTKLSSLHLLYLDREERVSFSHISLFYFDILNFC